jgi:hypothetical protein
MSAFVENPDMLEAHGIRAAERMTENTLERRVAEYVARYDAIRSTSDAEPAAAREPLVVCVGKRFSPASAAAMAALAHAPTTVAASRGERDRHKRTSAPGRPNKRTGAANASAPVPGSIVHPASRPVSAAARPFRSNRHHLTRRTTRYNAAAAAAQPIQTYNARHA